MENPVLMSPEPKMGFVMCSHVFPTLARPLFLQGCLWPVDPWVLLERPEQVLLSWFVVVSSCSWISHFLGTLMPGSSPEGLGCDLHIKTFQSPQGIILCVHDRPRLGTCLWEAHMIPFDSQGHRGPRRPRTGSCHED